MSTIHPAFKIELLGSSFQSNCRRITNAALVEALSTIPIAHQEASDGANIWKVQERASQTTWQGRRKR